MKIVYGITRPDAGSIEWEGRKVSIHSSAQARRLGIGMVFQHFALFETLNVAENIALALDERTTPAALAPRIDAVARRYGLPIDPERLVHSMSVGERQRVEIVRCLLQSPKLLIMDEPTSVLTPQAVRQLFETLHRLAAEGRSILYISHKLEEIRSLCDNATVLRAGRVSGTARPRELDTASLARLMVGSDLTDRPPQPRETGEVRLELKNYSMAAGDPFGTALHRIDLEVRSGEIVGVSGNGQKELLAALSGESIAPHEGSITLCGRRVDALGAARRRVLGLGFVPEERLGRGAVPGMSLAENTLLTGSHATVRLMRPCRTMPACEPVSSVFSARDMPGTAPRPRRSSGTNPKPRTRRRAAPRASTRRPHRVIEPSWGAIDSPDSAASSSFCPLPDTPATPTISPERTSRSIRCNAVPKGSPAAIE